jgi:YD repeat-containing protein
MHPRAQCAALRIAIALVVGLALLSNPVSIVVLPVAQGQRERPERVGHPRPDKPEGELPNLDDVQNESQMEREPLHPIHSTIRSPRNASKPWDGRRLGDPDLPRDLDQAVNNFERTRLRNQPRRAHASRRLNSSPPVPDNQFVQNFFTWALVRNPNSAETTYWHDQLRVAFGQGQSSVKLAAIECGRTLFESAEYAARNRDAHWYVHDLYKTYLMRDPDAGGWTTWENLVPTHGREYVRRGFEESTEFSTLVATLTPNGSPTTNATSLVTARVDPRNQPGHGMLARDANWSVPLLSLPGRAGLDLGLSLSYSSQVWTRSGPYIYFDEDNGFPSPGFRLGFPTVQRKVFNAQTAKNSYLLLTAGRRMELRQVGTSNIYDAADSSYLRLTDNGTALLVHSTDGTKMSFSQVNGEFRCVEVKERNGNFISINYNALGRITNITDTLGRIITFNYDSNANLISITQAWNGQQAHQWVSFGWGTRNVQSSFSGVAVIGTSNGTSLPVITQVNLNDTSHLTFDYTNSLQIAIRRNFFGAIERNVTSYNYETPSSNVPRLLSSSVSARNWTGINGVPVQVTTQYSVASDGACILTAPDGTIYKEYYGTGWQKGLTTLSEVWSGGVRQKWTTTAWTQDNVSVSYETNPRITETNVYDASGNRRRTTIDYGSYWQYGLPYGIREFGANGTTEIRQTFIDYNLSQAYLDRRIIGLVSQVHVSNVVQSQSKTTYAYDDPAQLYAVPAAATQHDASYSLSLTARGNLTKVSRWDVTDINNAAKKLSTYTNYYTTGSPIRTIDSSGHQSDIAYNDSFSDNINRNTFAYPTTLTDPDGFSSNVQYNFDFGATTRTQSPAPAGQSQGAIQNRTYNSLGQLERITTSNNGAYKRFWYGADYVASYATVNNVADEAYSIEVVDGVGRVIGAASNHPGSSGGYRLINTIYDQMGRVWKRSNPTEVNNSWVPSGDDVAGIYYTQQTYDWNGRPLITTNSDGTTREISYAGCGCAGGEVATLTDEGTLDAGVAKRRQRKVYSDVLGRNLKTELLSWQGGTVYSTTVNVYNARDQVEQILTYAGSEGSSNYQQTTLTYDGYGRLKTRHVPEQAIGSNTVWTYNEDDTVQKITDGRGATSNLSYNNRHLLTGITYTVPSGSQIPVPPSVSYSYDAAANRSTMSDGTGAANYNYDQLSRIASESRTFAGLSGTYALNYSYNLTNALTSLAIPFKSKQIGYSYDSAGRLSSVSASGFSARYSIWPYDDTQNITSFASNITYRAWGGRKSMTYGNATSEQLTYTSRLQPATYTLNNMSYQNTNVCCSYPTYSTMSWTFGYYADGRPKHAWDSTNEWFDRTYKYDHAGRLKEASTYRRARGLSPFPAVSSPDPYYQSITYDAFNHNSRTGKLFTGEPSDIGTYVNNRRVGAFWEYDTDGNVTRDSSYQQTIDAAGEMNRSVSLELVGDGIQYPYQPRLDITQTHDGSGKPAKRVQISRVPGIDDEFGNSTEPVEDTQTTYYLKSSVLGGAAVVEFGGEALGDTIHIYASGQRIARELWGSVNFEHHNPVTGSWVTSHGHSSFRTTGREERDPRGAEAPLANPYAFAQSYVDWKFGEQLFIEGGNPFDYSSGREIDGIPVTESEFQRRVNNGSVMLHKTDRRGNTSLGSLEPFGGRIWVDDWTIEHSVSNTEFPLAVKPDGSVGVPTNPKGEPEGPVPTVTIGGSNDGYFITIAQGLQLGNQGAQGGSNPQNRATGVDILPRNLLAHIFTLLDDNRCSTFVSNLINVARQLTGRKPFTYDGKALAIAVANQPNGGFIFRYGGQGGGSAYGDIFSGEATAELAMFNTTYGPRHPVGVHYSYALTALHELIHLAGGATSITDGSRAYYMDVVLARATQILTDAPGYPAGYDPNMPWWQITAEMTGAAGDYWGKQFREHCTPQEYK